MGNYKMANIMDMEHAFIVVEIDMKANLKMV